MRTTLALFTALAVTLLAPTGCEVVLTGSARITNDIAWTMTEVRIGKSVEDALAQPSLGSLAAGASMVVLDLSETFRWTVVALDAD
ncbi:MAG: hypothetical protein QF464_18490, partial [Myxococcota bacterium]|nr:hypothetical protein [Myxococcota bacterium]